MQIIGPHFRLNESEVCGGWGRAAVASISAPGDSDEPSSLRTRTPGLCMFLSRKNPSTCAPDFSLSPTQGNGPIKPVFHIPVLPPLDHSHQHTNGCCFCHFFHQLPPSSLFLFAAKTPKRKLLLAPFLLHSLEPTPARLSSSQFQWNRSCQGH